MFSFYLVSLNHGPPCRNLKNVKPSRLCYVLSNTWDGNLRTSYSPHMAEILDIFIPIYRDTCALEKGGVANIFSFTQTMCNSLSPISLRKQNLTKKY